MGEQRTPDAVGKEVGVRADLRKGHASRGRLNPRNHSWKRARVMVQVRMSK